jgi:cytochrome c2
MKKYLGIAAMAMLMASCGGSAERSVRNDDETIAADKPVELTGGHKLFVNNCIQCHSIKKDKIGPKLEGVLARWDNDTTRMYAFIKNSSLAIKNGDPRAVKVFEEWNKTMMTPMTHLSDNEIDEIMNYIYKGEE